MQLKMNLNVSLQVEWLCNGALVKESNRLQFIADGVFRRMEMAGAQMEEAGDYTVRVCNEETATVAHLTVNG